MTPAKAVDFSKITNPDMKYPILRFVRGIRGPRQNPVAIRDIERHFSGTPKDFVHKQVHLLTLDDLLVIKRNGLRHAGYIYEITEAGAACLTSTKDAKEGGQK